MNLVKHNCSKGRRYSHGFSYKQKTFFLFLSIGIMSSTFLFSQNYFEQNFTFKSFKEGQKWGFKKDNKIVIPATFDYVTDFSENLALVKSNGKWGYIDTLGSWYIEASFDKGQPVQWSQAFVQNGTSIGLMNMQNKTFILDPIYTEIKEDYDAYIPYMNGKMGYLKKEKSLEDNVKEYLIPAKYDSIYNDYSLTSGKNADNTWDLYYDGKLILEKIDSKIESNEFIGSSSLIQVTQNGKMGIYELYKGWIIEPKHVRIDFFNFPNYSVNGREFNKIFVSSEKGLAPAYMDESNTYVTEEYMDYMAIADSASVYKQNGDLVSSKKYFYFSSTYDSDYGDFKNPLAFQLSDGKTITFLTADFKLIESKYTIINPINSSLNYLASNDSMSYILDKNLKVLASYSKIEMYKEYKIGDGTYIDPETGEYNFEDVYQELIVNEPFLLVFRNIKNTDLYERAIFQLDEAKIISPWIPEDNNEFKIERLSVENQTLYYYSYLNNSGFYIKGMEKGTEIKYVQENMLPIIQNHFLFRIDKGEYTYNDELYALKKGKLELVSNEYEVLQASEMFIETGYYDEETQDYMIGRQAAFTANFFVLRKNKKYGLIDFMGNIHKTIYDSLVQSQTNENFIWTLNIDSSENILYGNIDLFFGKEILPISYSGLDFNADLYVGNGAFYYTSFFDSQEANQSESYDYMYYMSLNGKKFKGKPETTFPKKVKGKYGLYAYSIYSEGLEKTFEQVKPQYKFLEQSFMNGIYRAQGKNKKWGYINFIGDTLIPLKYTSFDFSQYNGDNYFYVGVMDKKKKGLYNMNVGEIVPCIYEEVEILFNNEGRSSFKVKLNGKYGMISKDGEQLLSHNYDNIESWWNENYPSTFIATKNKKKIVFKMWNLDETKVVEYDFVAETGGFILKNETIEVYDILESKLLNTISLKDAVISGNIYNIVIKDGKFGATDLLGNELIACEYDYANFMEYRDEVMIGYQDGVKYYIYVETKEKYTENQW